MYPTKKEVLGNLPDLSFATNVILRDFGRLVRNEWKRLTTIEKYSSLKTLIAGISLLSDKDIPEIRISEYGYSFRGGTADEQAVIYLGTKPSIISSLHELGHYLHGDSELRAQAFAVACYKIINPTLEGLQWKGHLLVQTQQRSRQKTVPTTSQRRKTVETRSVSKQKQAGT